MANPPRRPVNPKEAAEALFRPVKKPPAAAIEVRAAVPGGRQMVTLKIDSGVLEHFQKDGPGWQDRINDALRALVADKG